MFAMWKENHRIKTLKSIFFMLLLLNNLHCECKCLVCRPLQFSPQNYYKIAWESFWIIYIFPKTHKNRDFWNKTHAFFFKKQQCFFHIWRSGNFFVEDASKYNVLVTLSKLELRVFLMKTEKFSNGTNLKISWRWSSFRQNAFIIQKTYPKQSRRLEILPVRAGLDLSLFESKSW